MVGRQLVFGFDHRPAMGEESFLIAQSNRDAVAWIDRWPDWPGRILGLYGPCGSGKSHLAHVWQRRSNARWLAPSDINQHLLETWPGKGNAFILEGDDRNLDETVLFHLINLVREDEGFLLLTSSDAPARWSVALPDLASRLSAIPSIALGPPDDALIAAVLAKQFQDRQLKVPSDVIAYLVARMERSFAAIGETVTAIDALSLSERRAITVHLARHALESTQAKPDDERT